MDEVYIKKVCEGNTEAFRYFLKKYKDMAFTIAVSVVKDEFYAEEVVQDAFLKAFHGLKSFKKNAKFSTWLYRIVINEAFMKLRNMKKEIVSYVPEHIKEPTEECFIFELQQDQQKYYINEALKRISANESLVLRLFYLQGTSVKEICEMTGWSDSKVKVVLFRARKNMQQILSQVMNSNG